VKACGLASTRVPVADSYRYSKLACFRARSEFVERDISCSVTARAGDEFRQISIMSHEQSGSSAFKVKDHVCY
jgi:hypothetical protein